MKNRKIKTWFVFVVWALFIGCVSVEKGSDKEVKSKLGYLNGKTYGATPHSLIPGAGIPVGYYGQIHNRMTKISGELLVKENLLFSPINNEKIILKNSHGKVIHEFKSGMAGQFNVNIEIPNGQYELIVDSNKYEGSIKIEITTYEIDKVKLIVQQK